MNNIKYIAFYLPQYHSIPENDLWWGEGFTEWTNVKKAKKLFNGHYQPHIPTHLGYYNLLNDDVRFEQAMLAQNYGIYGFCYWHYWFGNNKILLEKPAQMFLKNKNIDFPICFAWANQTWTGIWHGLDDKILINQDYLGQDDDERHFNYMLPFFCDSRYITKDGKPVFILYRPFDHPYLDKFIDTWTNLALRNGLNGIYFLGISYSLINPSNKLDGFIYHRPWRQKLSLFDKFIKKTTNSYPDEIFSKLKYNCIRKSFLDFINNNENLPDNVFPTILTGWDNTPRCGNKGTVFYDYNPDVFGEYVRNVKMNLIHRQETFCFVKSWNEWAEGNYLEPEERFGNLYLEAFKANS